MTQTKQSETLSQLASALIGLQSELQFASKSCANPYFKSKYADLTEVWSVCAPLLSKYKLAVFQCMDVVEACYEIKSLDKNDRLTGDYKGSKQNALVTTLCHESGEWIKSIALINAVKPDPQANGSAITYMRRYQLCSILGVIQEDDDGERAMNRKLQEKIKEESVSNLISAVQFVELNNLFSLCSVDYKKEFEKWLKTKKYDSLSVLPSFEFDRIKSVLTKKAEECQSFFDEEAVV